MHYKYYVFVGYLTKPFATSQHRIVYDRKSGGEVISVPAINVWMVEVQPHSFLISAPDGAEWSPSGTARFTMRI